MFSNTVLVTAFFQIISPGVSIVRNKLSTACFFPVLSHFSFAQLTCIKQPQLRIWCSGSLCLSNWLRVQWEQISVAALWLVQNNHIWTCPICDGPIDQLFFVHYKATHTTTQLARHVCKLHVVQIVEFSEHDCFSCRNIKAISEIYERVEVIYFIPIGVEYWRAITWNWKPWSKILENVSKSLSIF